MRVCVCVLECECVCAPLVGCIWVCCLCICVGGRGNMQANAIYRVSNNYRPRTAAQGTDYCVFECMLVHSHVFVCNFFFFMWHINKHAYRNIRLLYVGLCLHEEILCMNEVGRAAEETDRGPDRVRQTVRQRGVTSHSCCKCSVFHCQ